MQILAILEHRSEKLLGPLEAVDADATVYVRDDTQNRLRGYFDAVRKARRSLRNGDPDVLVGDHAGIASLLVVCLGAIYGVPAIIRLGGNPKRLYRERRQAFRRRGDLRKVLKYDVLRVVAWVLYRCASGFLVVSTALEAEIRPLVGCDSSRIEIVRPPIYTDRFATADGSSWHHRLDTDQLVLTVTNLAFEGKYDGVRDTVEGMESVLRARPDVSYAIAGDGLYLQELRDYIADQFDSELASRVHLLGFVEDIEELYAAADIVVYSSYVDGYPNVVREAQAAGRPVVATPSHGVSEQIEDGVDGMLVDPNPQAFTEAIEGLLDDEERRKQLGDAAQRRVAGENDPETIGRELLAALERLR